MQNYIGFNFATAKMVRYFINNYEDYKAGTSANVNKEETIQQISEHINNITKRVLSTPQNVDGGLYVGTTGISYMFLHLSKNPMLSSHKKSYMEKAVDYLRPALETSAGDKTSFLLGDAGTYALATVINKEISSDRVSETLEMYRSLYNTYLSPKFLKCGGDEFFVGRAGYIAGALWMSRELQSTVLTKKELFQLCDVIVESGRAFSLKHKSLCQLMYHYYDTQYLGAAHGVSFILQMLISIPGYLEYNKSAAKDIKSSINYIVSIQTEEGNWPCCMEELGSNDHKLVHWCHGAPGIIYLMAKAYLIYKEKKYYDACVKAADVVWQKGLLRKGAGICHGVAGSGYVFLLMHRLSKDDKYLYRAKKFAEFMQTEEFLRDARVADNPESLYEGAAGTVCFLADLLMPDKAEFPFQDVFSN